MIDSPDLMIIRLLLKDSRTPLSKIAQELGMSQPAAQKRVEKLRSKGILVGSTAIINESLIGWKRAVVALNVRRAGYHDLLDLLVKLPLVTAVYQSTGPYAITVELLGPSGVVNGVISHIREMKCVTGFCPITMVERVV